MRINFVILLMSFGIQAAAKNQPQISYEAYMEMVVEHHPMKRIADIQVEYGEAEVLKAKGAFDPNIQGNFQGKEFDNSRYYNLLQGAVKIPTWAGVTVQGGYDQNDGEFINAERFTPEQGLIHAGVTIALGQGMFIDKRRAEFRKALLAKDMAVEERKLILNQLLFDAGSAYWYWFEKHHSEAVYMEAVAIAAQRLEGVRQSAMLGDRPYIDTLETSIQLQTRTLQLQKANLEVRNAAALLSIYLWLEGELPMTINPQSVPSPLDLISPSPVDLSILANINERIAAHPILINKALEINQTEIDQRWKREQLKPNLDLKYNALSEPTGNSEIANFNSNDYTVGVSFSMPILLRKERASIRMAEYKVESQEMKISIERQELWFKTRASFNEWDNVNQQLQIFENTVQDYESLLNGETELFQIGESSIFLLNSRESNFLKAKVQLIELLSRNKMAELKTLYSLADLN
ncbi:MAG: outer membrane protein TolC [Patiriisocius sp.]|jgi:outer membrane protein TolC